MTFRTGNTLAEGGRTAAQLHGTPVFRKDGPAPIFGKPVGVSFISEPHHRPANQRTPSAALRWQARRFRHRQAHGERGRTRLGGHLDAVHERVHLDRAHDLTDPRQALLDLPGQTRPLRLLTWHGETYRPPSDAVPLASDDRYEHQATRYGDRAWGFQFHLEVDPPGVRRLASSLRRDAAAAGGTGDLAAAIARSLPMLRPHRDRVLARFAALVAPS